MGEEVKTVLEVKSAVSMHVDERTGRHYSYNEATGHTQWLSDDDDEREATHENVQVGESTQQTKHLFRKFVDDEDGVYYENVETGEVVWDLPMKEGEVEEEEYFYLSILFDNKKKNSYSSEEELILPT